LDKSASLIFKFNQSRTQLFLQYGTVSNGICTLARKMTSFRQSENIIVFYD